MDGRWWSGTPGFMPQKVARLYQGQAGPGPGAGEVGTAWHVLVSNSCWALEGLRVDGSIRATPGLWVQQRGG